MPITYREYEKSTGRFSGPATDAYVGAVLADRESNGYDSDFYAIVWDAERGQPREITYASTRYAAGGSCTVDATDEVRAAYAEWQDAERARLQAERDARDTTDAESMGLTLAQYRRLEASTGQDSELFNGYRQLLTTRTRNRFRSTFRRSLADQIWNWTQDASPKYDSPLSARQRQYVYPRRY